MKFSLAKNGKLQVKKSLLFDFSKIKFLKSSLYALRTENNIHICLQTVPKVEVVTAEVKFTGQWLKVV